MLFLPELVFYLKKGTAIYHRDISGIKKGSIISHGDLRWEVIDIEKIRKSCWGMCACDESVEGSLLLRPIKHSVKYEQGMLLSFEYKGM